MGRCDGNAGELTKTLSAAELPSSYVLFALFSSFSSLSQDDDKEEILRSLRICTHVCIPTSVSRQDQKRFPCHNHLHF